MAGFLQRGFHGIMRRRTRSTKDDKRQSYCSLKQIWKYGSTSCDSGFKAKCQSLNSIKTVRYEEWLTWRRIHSSTEIRHSLASIQQLSHFLMGELGDKTDILEWHPTEHKHSFPSKTWISNARWARLIHEDWSLNDGLIKCILKAMRFFGQIYVWFHS